MFSLRMKAVCIYLKLEMIGSNVDLLGVLWFHSGNTGCWQVDVKWSGEKLLLKNAFSNRRCSVWQIALLLSSISHRCKPVFTSSPSIIAEAKTSFPLSHCLKVLSTLREWPCGDIASILTKKERFAWSPSHKDILLQISCAPESAFTEHICQSRQMDRDCLFYIQCQQESALDFRWCQSVTVNLTKTLMVQPECPTYTEKRQIIKNKPRRRTTQWILHLAWIKTKNAWKKYILLWHVQGCTLQKEAGIENGWIDMEERLHSIKTKRWDVNIIRVQTHIMDIWKPTAEQMEVLHIWKNKKSQL